MRITLKGELLECQLAPGHEGMCQEIRRTPNVGSLMILWRHTPELPSEPAERPAPLGKPSERVIGRKIETVYVHPDARKTSKDD